jgi:RHS repeat-associated protein
MSGYGFTQAGTAYDDEDRLTGYARANSNLTQSWSLTSVGDWSSITTNGTAQTRTHGPTHELLTAGGQNVTTDVKGNITVLPSNLLTPASTLGLVYDFDNKMKSADVGNNRSVDVEYKYDALGRRVARSGSSGSCAYVQAAQQTLVDYGLGDAPSSPLYRYVYGSYIDEPVVRKGAGSGGTVYYYHRNQQYSVTAITNSSAGVVERYAYQAYGEPTILDASGSVISSSSINNRYTYTGREWDSTVGLYHFRARWMSGLTGRFLTRDPIGYNGSPWDLYEFVASNPVRRLDPSGLVSIDCHCTCRRFSPEGTMIGIEQSVKTVDCGGSAATCCASACASRQDSNDYVTECEFRGKWKIVPGVDAYDEAEEEFNNNVCEIALCCVPIGGGPIVGGISRTCFRGAIVMTSRGHAMVRIVSPSGKIFYRHMPGQSFVGKPMTCRGTDYYLRDIQWWSRLFPEVPLRNPVGTSSTICSPNCVWTAIRAIGNGL